TVTHSTFSTNAADIGGGIFADTGGTLTVTESTFSGNSADVNGGGISNVGMAYLAGVILDTGPSGPNCLNSGTLTDNGYNLSDDASCGFSGTSANNVTLNLSALSVTTTPGQQVHTPQAGSVAISVIPNGTTINNNGVTLACNQTTTDQLGSNRPINGGDPCTSGAVEVPPLCPTPLAISDTDELANCIIWANTNPDADTLGLDADITLSAVLPQITTEITLEGAGYTIDGANTYRVFEVTSTGNLTVNQITVQNGRSLFSGGGILNDSGTLTVTNSTFSGNFASNNGGAITNNIGGTLTVANSTISGNTANSNGGGIYNASGTVTVTNSTFSNNSSPSNAGGILNFNGVLTVTHSTFSGNSAPAGGGILNTGTVHLAGVILDTGTSGPNCANSGTLNDNGYNLSDDASCGFSGTSADSATLNLGALTG
ncbi:MAG: hypothetical protein R3330_15560, partial [Saprospiraceae bacterium]|nr:hypothetical protein [Saprospiraceae bacterium]